MRTRAQLRKSWYILAFQLPGLPERMLRARGFHQLRMSVELDAPPGSFGPADMERYVEAWRRPGALTAMLDYYRGALRGRRKLPPITAETLVIWGDRDRYLGSELAVPHARDVPNLRPVVFLEGTSHWVMRDEPDRVSELLAGFFGEPG